MTDPQHDRDLKSDGSRTALLWSVLLTIAALALSALFWDRVPDPAPIHWNANGDPDGWAPRWVALTMMPAISLGIAALVLGLARIDPRSDHTRRSTHALGHIVTLLSMFFFGLHALLLHTMMSPTMRLSTAALIIGIGTLFVALGSALPKFGSNYFIGIRTPWTLNDERVWSKTQRLGGMLFVLTGLATILLAIIAPTAPWLIWVMLTMILTSAIIPIVYSWRISLKKS